MKDLILNSKRALVVVAHPDDETIWMGGTIQQHPDVDWTILVLCRRHDPDRYPKFMRVAKHYGARGVISDLDDEAILTLEQTLPEIEQHIMRLVPRKKYDVIFTHGAAGEYGHERHIGVHRVVKMLVQKKLLQCDNLFFFSYDRKGDRAPARARTNADYVIRLSKKELKDKRDIVKKLYGFSQYSFENRSCNQTEPFTRL